MLNRLIKGNASKSLSTVYLRYAVLSQLFLLTATASFGQIAFSPTILYLSDQEPVKEIRLSNVSDSYMEIDITARFGYPEWTESGSLEMVYNDSISATQFGLGDRLKIYPQKAIIPPRAQQTIRLRVANESINKNRLYWTRLGIRSGAAAQPVGVTGITEQTASVTFEVQQNLGVYYKHGELSTGVTLNSVNEISRSDTLKLAVSCSRTGNSPYIGIMSVRLVNGRGLSLAESEQIVNLFFDSEIPVSLVTGELPAGQYKIEVRFETSRGDIPEGQLVSSPLQVFTREILID